MTAPSAANILAEVRQLGGHMRAKAGGKLGVMLPEAEKTRLLPAIRERKSDLLMLLRYPATACPACNGDRYWRGEVGLWRCAKCEPETPPDPFGPLPAGEEAALGHYRHQRSAYGAAGRLDCCSLAPPANKAGLTALQTRHLFIAYIRGATYSRGLLEFYRPTGSVPAAPPPVPPWGSW